MIISAVQQRDPVIYMHISILSKILFAHRLLQNTRWNSLCHAEGPRWPHLFLNWHLCPCDAHSFRSAIPTLPIHFRWSSIFPGCLELQLIHSPLNSECISSPLLNLSCDLTEMLWKLRAESLESIRPKLVGDLKQTSFAFRLMLILHVGSPHGESLGQCESQHSNGGVSR